MARDPVVPFPLGAPARARMERVVFVDVARSVAIFGALTLHCLLVFKVWDQLAPGALKAVGNGLFRACTPTFFLLFGVILEWVYVDQVGRDGGAAVARRLGRRAVQCYLGLALGACAAAIGGGLTWAGLPSALVGLSDVPLSSVLRFYTFALIISIPVVILRPRLGPALPLALIAVIWLASPLLDLLSWPQPGSTWAFPCAFLFGHPPLWVGGSLWHDMSLVFVGMVLGNRMRARMELGLAPFGGGAVLALTGLCLAVVAASAATLGVHGLAEGYLGTAMTLRFQCHPAYFALSTLTALGLLGILQRLFPAVPSAPPRWPLMALGRHSLFAFAVGNAGLSLLAWTHMAWWMGLPATIAYMGTMCLLVRSFDRRQGR